MGRCLIKIFISALFTCAVMSCVDENRLLGYGVIPTEEQFITRTITIPLSEIYLSEIDSLTGYSTQRMTLGAIRDTTFGLTRRGAAIALVPITDTVKWGHNVRVRYFHFSAYTDSISYRGANNASIIQQVRVYPNFVTLDSTLRYSCELHKSDYEGLPLICKGVPTYNGGDSLSFDFVDDFARSYIPEKALPGGGTEDVTNIYTADSIPNYKKLHKGFYVCTDDPIGYGGRINFFETSMTYNDSYYVIGNYAALHITADYGTRKDVDTTILFAIMPDAFNDEGSYYSFNTCETEYIPGKTFGQEVSLYGKKAYRAGKTMNIEGGVGLKPIVLARHLKDIFRNAVNDTLVKYGYASADAAFTSKKLVVNKATMSFFYDMPDDYEDMIFYPAVLNPTLRINNEKVDTVVYGSLTDASISDENQGTIDRFNCCFKPDITHHLQEILKIADTCSTEMIRKDIWFMILANETVEVKSSTSDSDYYNQLAYLSYYNSMMGGGYGSYGSGYSNYYNYYMMQALYNSSSSGDSYSTVQTLDTDRYYNAVLHGPGSKTKAPKLVVSYSFLRIK